MPVRLIEWLAAFVFTQAVEMPIYRFGAGTRWSYAALPSAVTHPLVWLVFFGPLVEADHGVRLATAELFAIVVEAAILARKVPPRRAILLATFANAASVALGELSRRLTGMP